MLMLIYFIITLIETITFTKSSVAFYVTACKLMDLHAFWNIHPKICTPCVPRADSPGYFMYLGLAALGTF